MHGVGNAELRLRLLDVAAYCFLTQAQVSSDLRDALAHGHQAQHRQFARRQTDALDKPLSAQRCQSLWREVANEAAMNNNAR